MMKKEANLLIQIADIDNLRLAYYNASKGKLFKKNVWEYQENLHSNLLKLQNDIMEESINVGHYNYFMIHDPKERKICAANFNERVLHHAIIQICHPYYEKFQIYDSYACRKNKGVYAALDRAQYFAKKNMWYLKLDVRKYFDSIPHENLKQSISKIFIDKPLLNLKNKIIESYSGLNQNTGVPIGNLTSQYWANHYLAKADHYIYEQLQCKGYVRYMDDMLIFENNKQALLNIGQAFNEFITSKLNLVLKPFVLNKISYGIPFLSYKVYANGIGLSQKAKRRFSQKNRLYNFNFDNQIWDEKKYISHLQPLVSFINKAKCYHFKQKQFNYE